MCWAKGLDFPGSDALEVGSEAPTTGQPGRVCLSPRLADAIRGIRQSLSSGYWQGERDSSAVWQPMAPPRELMILIWWPLNAVDV